MYERFAEYYDRWMQDANAPQWAAYLLDLFALHGKGDALRILDVACGTGNISIPLAQAGHRVVGVDISEDMLEIAQEKTRLAGLAIPYLCQDMLELDVDASFDIINCSCDGINYLIENDAPYAFFMRAAEMLKADGLLCFDISSAHKLIDRLDGHCFAQEDEEAMYVWQNAYDIETNLLDMYVTFFVRQDHGLYERFEETHIQRVYEISELIECLQNADFDVLGVYGDFTKEAPTETNDRIFFVARPSETINEMKQ